MWLVAVIRRLCASGRVFFTRCGHIVALLNFASPTSGDSHARCLGDAGIAFAGKDILAQRYGKSWRFTLIVQFHGAGIGMLILLTLRAAKDLWIFDEIKVYHEDN